VQSTVSVSTSFYRKQQLYCLDLLWLLTLSAVGRMRRRIAACSLRARASVSATSSSLAPQRKAVSARASHRARSSSLGWLRVPRSSAGSVACGTGTPAGFFMFMRERQDLRCHNMPQVFDTEHTVFPEYLFLVTFGVLRHFARQTTSQPEVDFGCSQGGFLLIAPQDRILGC
jgi:hypothetical protein